MIAGYYGVGNIFKSYAAKIVNLQIKTHTLYELPG